MSTPDSRSSAPSPQPFPAGRYAAWLVGPLALAMLAAKVHKVAGTGLGGLLAALFADVALVLVFGGLTALALRASRGRGVVRVVLHLMVLAMTLLVFVEHGFWVTTGTLLDPFVLGYGLEHFGSLGKVYLSAMGPLVWLGFALLLGVHALPILFTRRPARPWFRRPLLALVAAVATTGIARLAVGPTALGDNVVLSFGAEALVGSSTVRARTASAATAAPVVLGRGPRAIADGPAPNVIVIMMESVRASATTPYAPGLDTTPFLASLAARGALVEQTWTTVTHTSKALVGALCGIHPMLDLPVVEAEATGLPTECLARILRGRGYATAFMQTATASFEQRRQIVENMGYETFLSKETIDPGAVEETSYFGWADDALVQPVLDFADARRGDGRPFFLTLLNLSTHHTYDTPRGFDAPHRADGDLGKYLSSVQYFDGVLARLFAGLEARGALDRTLVVLAGDHGEAFGEHGTLQHNAAIYEEGLHVPLVLVGPGIAPGTRIGGLRQLTDLPPTILEWLGTPVTSGLPGKSLLSSPGHTELFASCWLHEQCIATRDARWKYVWNYDKAAPELFDLSRDPLERADLLAATPESVWGPMKERLLAWKADTDARWQAHLDSAPRDFVHDEAPEVGVERAVVFSAPVAGGPPRPLARLIGIDAPGPVKAGEPIALALHWQVLADMKGWYPFTYLYGRGRGALPSFNAVHSIAGGLHPTSKWRAGTFVTDRFEIHPEVPIPAGTYDLAVGFFTNDGGVTGPAARALVEIAPDSGPDAPVVVEAGERRARILTIEIRPAARSPRR